MSRTIRTDGPIPVYVQIADYIAADIKAGRIKPGYAIPSETSMVQEFGVARDTARRAVQHLRDQGLVRTIPHRGTFVEPVDAAE
ncbi:GntR family transcriptional regulator [Actinoplanes sp. NPDC048988]|uniref:GntR family transcriptional regulator n=1 Tax=Actinoplanes sp. NPDC048988 TaxID=3363901 RepID=UPI00372307D9